MSKNTRVALVAALLAAASNTAFAAPCTGTAISGSTLATYIRDNLICAYKPDNTNGTDANERWSSIQDGTGLSGTLYEYARGANDPVDPTKSVGSWALVDNSNNTVSDVADATRVQYTYGSNTYNWVVRTTGGTPPYEFCDPANTDERIAYAKAAVGSVTPGSTTGNQCSWPNF